MRTAVLVTTKSSRDLVMKSHNLAYDVIHMNPVLLSLLSFREHSLPVPSKTSSR